MKVSIDGVYMKYERTVIAVKPDGIQRGLVGEIMSRFEKAGMKLVAAKLIVPTKEQVKKHYYSEEWLLSTGTKTIESYAKKGIKLDKKPKEVGMMTLEKLVNYLSDRPMMFMVWEGPGVVTIGRKIIGHTAPELADVGSIRGDYSLESYEMADGLDRALYNLTHASGSVEDAEKEMKLWFNKDEIYEYDLFIEELVHNKNWGRIKKTR